MSDVEVDHEHEVIYVSIKARGLEGCVSLTNAALNMLALSLFTCRFIKCHNLVEWSVSMMT